MTSKNSKRLNLKDLSAPTYAVMNRLAGTAAKAAEEAGLEKSLLELVRIRASQINGCAFCLDMHALDARAAGETEQRIYALNAWEETPFFDDRERAALALTEAITLVHDGHVPDEVYEHAVNVFGEAQLAQLVWAITVINAYNRVAITARLTPGNYTPSA
ncbi:MULTISPECIES: carboxymuconolactone decarboxylase family protein [Streptomycetaceae]|uniref:4-carboxymuconolactone decarboxylase domain containing protein n=1 Tax=Streptantibioticus cattleyicolor (strain ATCC 35852 / DSM 46488 / JCM 4925 / NBRC 14057 / NRRL 8057) TaxID=1003195 RepID=F8JQK8_STREN|nr:MULTISPECIES: carboxymuconolactone decarboxylase family protein [Streptomycetaceae]AEW97855.1 4-carboxymuconolactone decarboxylase domain containing protein [Streptantibioticus cattleyicolor NRRL 8057 = DSM 46488]MYS62269.1 carboxymuconolactone decarboxylase family protein [Streptomyces sp. SID5468]CCB78174.1 4-carboxymuconolactone decarboxylase domain containing protein [Streptantibioticus cattleyicolor NRRL 8057 = DSM 46488]